MILGGIYTSWDAWLAFASRRWPSIPGKLHLAGTYSHDSVPPVYRPVVRYQYRVGGVDFESTRIRFGGWNPFSSHLATSELPVVGRPLQVFYDPHNRRRACLRTGLNEWTLSLPILLFLGGVIFLAFGVHS